MKKLICTLFLIGAVFATDSTYVPFGQLGYLTSSFGESRGTRYHAGIDYSTEMQEGFPIIAPEDGKIVKVKVSPYSYGKVVYFEGKSGRTWLFAHQSGFSSHLDSLISATQKKKKKNDISLENPKIPAFRKGETISFSGSSGIGNPHLHLELRSGDKVLNPCRNGVLCGDTLNPLVLGAAVLQGENVALTGEDDLKVGCLEVPNLKNKQDPLHFVFKIADYSREPLENPMSIRRITLKHGNEIVGEVINDTLSYTNMIQIREELLWAEEADTAGDWHFIPNSYKLTGGDSLTFETEDMVGHITTRNFAFSTKCNGAKPSVHGKNQNPELFSFLSRSWLGLDLCKSDNHKTEFSLVSHGKIITDACKEMPARPTPLGKILEIFPGIDEIRLVQNEKNETIRIAEIPADAKDFEFKTQINGFRIGERVSSLVDVPWIRVLAVRKFQNDSIPAYEFHPKGLHFLGDWTVTFETKLATKPLYYLGETSRKWFLFSKQKKAIQERSATMNELRDIGFIQDTTAPELGEVRLDSAIVAGQKTAVLRIPVIENESGIENGNAIQASAKGKPFIYAEYDSEPHELVFILKDLPQTEKSFKVRIQDEAGNTKTFDVEIPHAPTSE